MAAALLEAQNALVVELVLYQDLTTIVKVYIDFRGPLHTSQISHLLLYPLLWLLVPGLSNHFCHCSHYNLLLRSALVSNIFGKWLQDFVSFGNS